MGVEQRAAAVRAAAADAAPALGEMLPAAASECLEALSAAEAAPVLERLPVDSVVASLRRLPTATAERLLAGLPHERREALQRVLRFPEGTAAALMDPTILMLPDDISVAEARVRLRRETAGLLHYLYVVDRARLLVGVLDVSELMHARSRDPIRSVMHERVEQLPAWMPAAAVHTHPGWRSFHAMPVTDDEGRLMGAIRYQTLRRLEQEDDGSEAERGTAATVSALGELFQLGVAGFVEGLSTAGAPRSVRRRQIGLERGGE